MNASGMLCAVYTWLGAAVGAALGLKEVGQRQANVVGENVKNQLDSSITEVQTTLGEQLQGLAWYIYAAAGAVSGLYGGAKYAFMSLWWWFTEDELKVKLLQGSPVKYKLRDFDELQGGPTTTRVPSPPRPQVSVAAVVRDGNDHLAQLKEDSKKAHEFTKLEVPTPTASARATSPSVSTASTSNADNESDSVSAFQAASAEVTSEHSAKSTVPAARGGSNKKKGKAGGSEAITPPQKRDNGPRAVRPAPPSAPVATATNRQ